MTRLDHCSSGGWVLVSAALLPLNDATTEVQLHERQSIIRRSGLEHTKGKIAAIDCYCGCFIKCKCHPDRVVRP